MANRTQSHKRFQSKDAYRRDRPYFAGPFLLPQCSWRSKDHVGCARRKSHYYELEWEQANIIPTLLSSDNWIILMHLLARTGPSLSRFLLAPKEFFTLKEKPAGRKGGWEQELTNLPPKVRTPRSGSANAERSPEPICSTWNPFNNVTRLYIIKCCRFTVCVTVCYIVLQCAAVWCSVVQCVAVCCSVSQCDIAASCQWDMTHTYV